MLNNIRKFFSWIITFVLLVLSAFLGVGVLNQRKKIEELEKTHSDLIKGLVIKEVELKKLNTDLQQAKLDYSNDIQQDIIKQEIAAKLKEIVQDKEKLNQMTKELDDIKTSGKGDITRVE